MIRVDFSPATGRFKCSTTFLYLLGALLFTSCGKTGSDSPKQTSAGETDSEATGDSVTNPPAAVGPGQDERVCFQCNGAGKAACRAAGCKDGKTDCPGACLRMSRGAWIHMDVAGHDPSELWQKFPNSSGKGGYHAWNHHHVGEVITYQNGVAVNIGKCKACGGATKVNCSSCKGDGKLVCEICSGKKFVPASWTATDNPWLNSQPDLIRLKDGQAILGRVGMSSADDLTIITRDKKSIRVRRSDILPKTGTNSSAIPPAAK